MKRSTALRSFAFVLNVVVTYMIMHRGGWYWTITYFLALAVVMVWTEARFAEVAERRSSAPSSGERG